MRAEHGPSGARWEPPVRIIDAARGLLDLLLPVRDFDGEAAQTTGLPARQWSRIAFLEDPVCESCGTFFGAECSRPPQGAEARIRGYRQV
jgi:hypothetical protein